MEKLQNNAVWRGGKIWIWNSIVWILIPIVPLNIYVNLGQFLNPNVILFIWIVVINYLVYRVFEELNE